MERYLDKTGYTFNPPTPPLRVLRDEESFQVHHWIEEVVPVVFKHLLKSIQIEAIPDVILVDSGEEGVILEVAEPTDPAVVLFRAVGVR